MRSKIVVTDKKTIIIAIILATTILFLRDGLLGIIHQSVNVMVIVVDKCKILI